MKSKTIKRTDGKNQIALVRDTEPTTYILLDLDLLTVEYIVDMKLDGKWELGNFDTDFVPTFDIIIRRMQLLDVIRLYVIATTGIEELTDIYHKYKL